MNLSSEFSSCARRDALAALRQLRTVVAAGGKLMREYRAMSIAESKLLMLGAGFEGHANRLASYAPPTVGEVDAMIAAVEEPTKTSCPVCDAIEGCSFCDRARVLFDESEAA